MRRLSTVDVFPFFLLSENLYSPFSSVNFYFLFLTRFISSCIIIVISYPLILLDFVLVRQSTRLLIRFFFFLFPFAPLNFFFCRLSRTFDGYLFNLQDFSNFSSFFFFTFLHAFLKLLTLVNFLLELLIYASLIFYLLLLQYYFRGTLIFTLNFLIIIPAFLQVLTKI